MSTGSSSNIIIRLQNLPIEARALDIRRFFSGLNIPDGGVHVAGGEKGDAFINFSSDDDARQAMMRSGTICGNPIKLFLSSRSEMQSVIAQVRAPSTNKPLTSAIEPNYSSNIVEQQEQNSANITKLPSASALSSLLAEFQAKAAQQQQQQQQQLQMQQHTATVDPANALLLAVAQNGNNPSALQQLLASLNEKQQQQQQQQQPIIGQQIPFQMPILTNPISQYSQSSNGWMTQQISNAFQTQRPSATNLLFQQQQQNLFPNYRHENNNALQTPITADEPYIRVRNIPIGYSYYNIKLLFSKYKLNLSDIKIINDQNGQRTGEIVLRLHTNKDVADLLSQDGRIQCFNSMLDIKKIDEYTFASAIDSYIPAHIKKAPSAPIKSCIRVTGLPKPYDRKDVKRFFTGCNVSSRPGAIFIETDTIDGPTFVEFETDIDAEKAFFFNGEQFGSSTVDMYRMTKADMENEINSLKRGTERVSRRPPLLRHEPTLRPIRNERSSHLLPTPPAFHRNQDSSMNIPSFPVPTNINQDQSIICLHLKNIPYSTTEKQIYDFFSDISIQIEDCKILLDRFNRGAGEALIRFRDPQTCQRAYETKNRQTFYGRTLDLRRLSLNEYQNAPLTPMLTANDLASPTTINQHFQQANAKRYPPYYERDDNRRNEKRPRFEGMGFNKDGNGFNRNSSRVPKDGHGYITKLPDEKRSFIDRRSSTPPNLSMTQIPALPNELNDYIGRILFLSNVPYRATREEILDFLRPYAPVPDTLKIRCDVNGKPTGFGVVACETAKDAAQAVAELNNQIFMARKITLQQR